MSVISNSTHSAAPQWDCGHARKAQHIGNGVPRDVYVPGTRSCAVQTTSEPTSQRIHIAWAAASLLSAAAAATPWVVSFFAPFPLVASIAITATLGTLALLAIAQFVRAARINRQSSPVPVLSTVEPSAPAPLPPAAKKESVPVESALRHPSAEGDRKTGKRARYATLAWQTQDPRWSRPGWEAGAIVQAGTEGRGSFTKYRPAVRRNAAGQLEKFASRMVRLRQPAHKRTTRVSDTWQAEIEWQNKVNFLPVLAAFITADGGKLHMLTKRCAGSLDALFDQFDDALTDDGQFRDMQARAHLAVVTVFQVAAQLHVLHEANAVHRDIKPANLLFNNDGEVLVGDFGLTAAAGVRSVAGTAAFLPMEAFKPLPAASATDAWALGITALFIFMTAKERACIVEDPGWRFISYNPAAGAAVRQARARLARCGNKSLQIYIARLLSEEPPLRPTMHDLLQEFAPQHYAAKEASKNLFAAYKSRGGAAISDELDAVANRII